MLRRLNYTNRMRLPRSQLKISLVETGGKLSFEADLSALKECDLPADARVFVEAYRQTNWMRFPFGSVTSLVAPAVCQLTQFDGPEGLLFRVKVTPANDAHRILAEADRIPFRIPDLEDSYRQPLLPVKPADLKAEIYKLDFSGVEPLLLVNKNVGNYAEVSISPAFISLVLPSILKEILIHVVVIDGFDDSTVEDDWRAKWLRFCSLLPGVPEAPHADAELEDKVDWMDNAVSSFAKSIQAQAKFKEFWTGVK